MICALTVSPYSSGIAQLQYGTLLNMIATTVKPGGSCKPEKGDSRFTISFSGGDYMEYPCSENKLTPDIVRNGEVRKSLMEKNKHFCREK